RGASSVRRVRRPRVRPVRHRRVRRLGDHRGQHARARRRRPQGSTRMIPRWLRRTSGEGTSRGTLSRVDASSPLYSFYEARLRASLDESRLPRHIAVMADVNRRWAREAGFTDVSHGYRAGATKIAELLGWCDELGIDLVTIYLLSTVNLSRDAAELEELLQVIADVVDEITGPDRNSEVRIVGRLEVLPDTIAERL